MAALLALPTFRGVAETVGAAERRERAKCAAAHHQRSPGGGGPLPPSPLCEGGGRGSVERGEFSSGMVKKKGQQEKSRYGKDWNSILKKCEVLP